MSKQDIEKRLGFAAQGVKAEMAIGSYKQGDRTVTVNGKKYEVLPYQMDFFIKELATLDTPEWRADVVKEYLRRGYIKATAARPGVKAEFVRFMDLETWKNSKGTVFTAGISDNAGQFQPYVTARDSSGGDQLRTLNAPTFKTEQGARKWLNTWMQNNKSTSSRPGVKAKFGTDSISVNMIAKRMVSKLKKIVPNEGLEQFHKRLLARINEIVKSTEEAIRNPDDANLQWTIQELKDVIRDEAGSSGSLNRATGVWLGSRPGAKAKMAAEIASDPRDKDFEKLKTLKGVVHQGKGFYIIPNKLMTPERRTKVKRSTQRYELSNMGDLVGWGTNHPNVNDYRLKDWAEAFA
jgi:hypothetical protein